MCKSNSPHCAVSKRVASTTLRCALMTVVCIVALTGCATSQTEPLSATQIAPSLDPLGLLAGIPLLKDLKGDLGNISIDNVIDAIEVGCQDGMIPADQCVRARTAAKMYKELTKVRVIQ